MHSSRTRFRASLRKNQRGPIAKVNDIVPVRGALKLPGKTGVWCFSTRRKIAGNDLAAHLDALVSVISPFADADERLRELREIMRGDHLQAHVTCFWRGPPGAPKPSILFTVTNSLGRLTANIEVDVANE